LWAKRHNYFIIADFSLFLCSFNRIAKKAKLKRESKIPLLEKEDKFATKREFVSS
jgi:hypothetical protein